MSPQVDFLYVEEVGIPFLEEVLDSIVIYDFIFDLYFAESERVALVDACIFYDIEDKFMLFLLEHIGTQVSRFWVD